VKKRQEISKKGEQRMIVRKSCFNISDLPSFYEAFLSPLFCAVATTRFLLPLRIQGWIAYDLSNGKLHFFFGFCELLPCN
jgi:hypothetical protein